MIFMNTLCAARSIFFSLGGPSFKIYLLIKNILLERGQMCSIWKRDAPGKTQRPQQGQLVDAETKAIGKNRWRMAERPKDDDVVPPDLFRACGHQCKGCK